VIVVQVSEQRIKVLNKIKVIPLKLKRFIHGYHESYTNGVEKFGVWWTIFQLSLWSFALIFRARVCYKTSGIKNLVGLMGFTHLRVQKIMFQGLVLLSLK